MVILYCPEYQCVKCPLLSQLFNIFLKGSSWKPKTVSYMRKYPAHSHIPRAELLIQDTQWALNNYLLSDPIDERMKFWEKSLTIWYVTSRDRWEFTTYMYMYVCVCVCAHTRPILLTSFCQCVHWTHCFSWWPLCHLPPLPLRDSEGLPEPRHLLLFSLTGDDLQMSATSQEASTLVS